MRFNTLYGVTLVCVLVGLCEAADDTRPVYEADQVFGPELADRGDREKKAIELKLAKSFGVKNFLLDLIFGKVNQVIDYKTRLVSNLDRTNRYKNYYLLGLGTPPKGVAPVGGSGQGNGSGVSTTTEEIPVLNGEKVNLDLPPKLFASGFTLVTNVSRVVGDVISNTARRTVRLVEALKPLLGKFLHIETGNNETGNDRSKRENIPASIARLAEEVEYSKMKEANLHAEVKATRTNTSVNSVV